MSDLWTVIGDPVDPATFGDLPIDELIAWYDRPVLFATRLGGDRWHLAYWSDEVQDRDRYIVSPITQEGLDKLRNNDLSLYDALHQDRVYALDVSHEWIVTTAWQCKFDDVPKSAIPKPGVYLRVRSDA